MQRSRKVSIERGPEVIQMTKLVESTLNSYYNYILYVQEGGRNIEHIK